MMMMNSPSIEELEIELARQDQMFEQATSAFEAAGSGAHFVVPPSFFEELAEACSPRIAVAPQFVLGIRA